MRLTEGEQAQLVNTPRTHVCPRALTTVVAYRKGPFDETKRLQRGRGGQEDSLAADDQRREGGPRGSGTFKRGLGRGLGSEGKFLSYGLVFVPEEKQSGRGRSGVRPAQFTENTPNTSVE